MTVGNLPPAPATAAGTKASSESANATEVSSAAFSMILGSTLGGAQAMSTGASPAQLPAQAATNESQISSTEDDAELSIEIEQLPADIAALLSAAPPASPAIPPVVPAPDNIDLTFNPEEVGAGLEIMFDEQSTAPQLLPQTGDSPAIVDSLVEFTLQSAPDSPQTVTQTQPATANTASAPAPADAPVHRELRAPVGTPAWADEIGGQLTLMTQQGRESASLKVSPEHLGPIEIHITVNDKDASVWFGAAHTDTRAALEQALPRLRELFAAEGLALTDAGVFREPPKQHSQSTARPHSERHSSDNGATGTVTPVSGKSVSLLDTYV